MKTLIKKWKEFCEVRPQAQHITLITSAPSCSISQFLPMASFIKTQTWKRSVSSEITCDTSFKLFVLKIKDKLKDYVKASTAGELIPLIDKETEVLMKCLLIHLFILYLSLSKQKEDRNFLL